MKLLSLECLANAKYRYLTIFGALVDPVANPASKGTFIQVVLLEVDLTSVSSKSCIPLRY